MTRLRVTLVAMSHTASVQIKRGVAGLGLFALTTFRRGDFIIEYVGEYINQAEADRRGGRYLFTIKEDCVIDGKARSNTARYINHSCRPNAFAEADEEALKIRIYAKKHIRPGEEIFYHYGQEYVRDIIGTDCRCPLCQKITD